MDSKTFIISLIFSVIILLADWALYRVLRRLGKSYQKTLWARALTFAHWSLTVFLVIFLWTKAYLGKEFTEAHIFDAKRLFDRYLIFAYPPKLLLLPILLVEDIVIYAQNIRRYFTSKNGLTSPPAEAEKVTRSEFLASGALALASFPLALSSYGILRGAHDYQVVEIKLKLKNLSPAFHGLRIAQISDLHTGSFFDKKAVQQGIELLLAQKADLIFFTGDLVNYETKEVKEYFSIYQKIKAPLGVFSILGNHDYGVHKLWPNQKAMDQNLLDMHQAHRELDWDLLLNESRVLKIGGEELAILGVENWGIRARHPKLGDIHKANAQVKDHPVKLLLSHDPSHWDQKVLPANVGIDVMFSGHTHGMQFGIDWGGIHWSPIQYIYEQWAGLYEKSAQKLYVNRGFGYADKFPARIGMPPEITIFELNCYK